MDGTSRLAERIHDEDLLWEHLAKRTLEGKMLPNMLQAAGKMAKIVHATSRTPFESVVLGTFLESASKLRGMLEVVISKIETALRYYLDNGRIVARYNLRHLIVSSRELQNKEQDLLEAIAKVQKRAHGLRSHKGPRLSNLVDSFRRTQEDNDTILEVMTEMINGAAASFETGASQAIDECVSSFVNLQQRKEQFQLAEKSAQFIERITAGAGSYHSADEAQYGSEAAVSMQEDIATDVGQWLSGSRRVYVLTGEPNTGKSRSTRGLCQYLHSERSPMARLGGSFFFAFGDKDLESFQLALLSLSYQVALHHRFEILDDVRRYLYCGEEEQLRHVAIRLLHKALAATSSSARTPCVLVLDGIDQCKEIDELPGLLRRVIAFVREFPWLYLFFASRPRPNVMGILAHPSIADIVEHGQLDDDIGRWKEDCAQYLQHTVPRIPAYSDYLKIHPDALQQLVQLAENDFGFAQLATRYLNADYRRPEARFNRLLSITKSESPLEELYVQQLELLAPFLSPDGHRCLRTVLRFIAYTSCSLTPDTISSYAHHISADDVVRIVDDCHAVLTIDHNWEIVPHDPSFPKFLLDMERYGELPLGLQANGASHAASICLAAISTINPITAIPGSLPPPNLLPENSHPSPSISFLSLWPRYLSESRPRADPDLMMQLDAFVPSLSLAMYAWVTEQADVHRAAGIIARYLVLTPEPPDYPGPVDDLAQKALPDYRRIISDFYAFVCYVQLWRDPQYQRIHAQDVIKAIVDGCQDQIVFCNTGLHDTVDLTFAFRLKSKSYHDHVSIGAGTLQEYYTIMEDFVTHLRGDKQGGDGMSPLGLLDGTFRAAGWA